jgi:hypothetical protein
MSVVEESAEFSKAVIRKTFPHKVIELARKCSADLGTLAGKRWVFLDGKQYRR